MDIPFTSALGYNPPNQHKKPPRKVQSWDPRSVKKYTDQVKKEFAKEDNAVIKGCQHLKEMHKTKPCLEEVIALYAAILEDNERLKELAAEKTKKFCYGKYAWSPEWKEWKAPTLLWKNVVLQLKGHKVKGNYII